MLKIKRRFKKAIAIMFILTYLSFSIAPIPKVYAAGLIEPTGIATDVGPEGQIGPSDTGITTDTDSVDQVADSSSASNIATGPSSVNENAVETTNQIEADTNSSETTDNNILLELNSGKNNLSENNQVGSLTTGQIDGTVNLLNVSGSSFAPGSSIGVETLDGNQLDNFQISENGIPLRLLFPNSVSSSNYLTGSDSLNTNNVDNHNLVSFITDEEILRNNLIKILANTGENTIDSNTWMGSIQTGDVNLGVNLINLSNLLYPNLFAEMNIWSILNGLNGDIILPSNTLTGPRSVNDNQINSSNNVSAVTDSSQDINNSFDINTNTGENFLSMNSKVGDIATGDTQVSGSVTNITNTSPIFYIINVFGKFLGNVLTDGKNFLINQIGGNSIGGSTDTVSNDSSLTTTNAANTLTGASSVNENNTDNQNDIRLDSKSRVNDNNMIEIDANTGKNRLTSNTFLAGLSTGSISILSNVVNVANFLTGKVRLGIINIFGDWKGNLVTKVQDPISRDEQISPPNTVESGIGGPGEDNTPAIIRAFVPANGIGSGQIEPTGILPLSGITFGEEPSAKDNPTQNTGALSSLIFPAGILLALSLAGEVALRRRKTK